MSVKYECPKCGRRFTEWGAEKVGFKCPKDQWCSKDHPDDVELVRVGQSEGGHSRRPSLKRTPKRKAAAAAAAARKIELTEDETLVPDVETLESEDADGDEDGGSDGEDDDVQAEVGEEPVVIKGGDEDGDDDGGPEEDDDDATPDDDEDYEPETDLA